MTKQVKLTNEERLILQKLTSNQLAFLKRISGDKDFKTLSDIVNILIDIEKNFFFGADGSKLTPDTLYAKHAYARGDIAGQIRLLHIIVGAEHELESRENERKKRKENNGPTE